MAQDNDPITLKDAASHFGFTVSTLRAEAGRGRLTIYKIGKRYWTTPAAVREMVTACRVPSPRQGFTSTPRDGNGLSETDHYSSAQAALSASVSRLRNSLPATSAANTRRKQAVIR